MRRFLTVVTLVLNILVPTLTGYLAGYMTVQYFINRAVIAGLKEQLKSKRPVSVTYDGKTCLWTEREKP